MTSERLSILDECPLSDDVDGACARARVYRLLFVQSQHDTLSRVVERLIVGIIILTTIALVASSIPELDLRLQRLLWSFEIAAAMLFAVEYVARLWSITASCSYKSPVIGRLRYAITFFAIVDLVSLAPVLSIVLGSGIEFFAVARLARLLKLGRYSIAVRSLVAVLSERRQELLATLGILSGMLLIGATGIYLVEHDAQPDAFRSIPHSLWWSVVTITTLGYGDVTPITLLGRIFASIIVILGLLIIAIPTGIVSAGFYNELRRRRGAAHRCPRCGEEFTEQE